jgi:hypothetical protein
LENSQARKKIITNVMSTFSDNVKVKVNKDFLSPTSAHGLPRPPKQKHWGGIPKKNDENNNHLSNQNPAAQLATDYAAKLDRMQARLNKEIKKNTYVPNVVKVPKPRKPDMETVSEKLAKEYESTLKIKNKDSGLGMDDYFPEKDEKKKEEEEFNTFGYGRSRRQVQDGIKSKFTIELEEAKT